MNKKRMQEHLKRKFDDWANSITDKNVQKMVKIHSIITGGCITSLLLGEHVNDYDIYFSDMETAYAVAKYYVDIFNKKSKNHKNRFNYHHRALVLKGGSSEYIEKQIKEQNEQKWRSTMLNIPESRVKIVIRSDGVAECETDGTVKRPDPNEILTDMDDIDYEKEVEPKPKKDEPKKKYQLKFLTSNAITLSNKIQCTTRFYGTPEEIHKNYDYIHCTNYWTSWYNQLVLNSNALEAILDKRLVYQGSKYPLSSVIRMRKFLRKGWKINAGQVLKMCFQLSELNLQDVEVLEDQLIGVDTMYFMDLIENIKHMKSQDPEFQIDKDYVCTLADKIFG